MAQPFGGGRLPLDWQRGFAQLWEPGAMWVSELARSLSGCFLWCLALLERAQGVERLAYADKQGGCSEGEGRSALPSGRSTARRQVGGAVDCAPRPATGFGRLATQQPWWLGMRGLL